MKRIVSLVVAVIMLLTMFSLSAFAGTVDGEYGTETHDVYASIGDSEYFDDTISVDIEWGSLEFKYCSVKKWNPETHAYDIDTADFVRATYDADEIYITNHSATALSIDFTYNAASDSGVSGSFEFYGNFYRSYDANSFAIYGWDGWDDEAEAQDYVSAVAKLKLSAESYSIPGRTKVGTVTITIGPPHEE